VSAPEQPTGVSDTGGVTDPGVSSTSPASTTETQEPQPLNPAWEPVLKDLPEYFHEKAKGHFRTWDDNYRKLEAEKQSLTEKYSPYEQYLGVDPQALQYGLGMLQRVQQDPLALYNALQEHVRGLGLLQEQQQQPGQDPNESVDLGEDPRLQEFERRQQQLDERQQQIDNYIQEQVYNQQVSGYEQDIDTQVQAVVQKYGQQTVDVPDLLQRMFIQTQQGGNFDAESAYQEQVSTFKRLYAAQQSNGRPAPNVLPVGGGTPAPSGEIKPEDMNEDQRKAYFKHLLDIANSGG
jgi:hypothetical protein